MATLQWGCVSIYIALAVFTNKSSIDFHNYLKNKPIPLNQISTNDKYVSQSECSDKSRSFTANAGTKAAVLLKGRYSTANS